MTRTAALPLLFALAACADGGEADFPSLAPRPIESRPEAVATPAPPPPLAANASQAAELSTLLAQAREGEEDFAEALPGTERSVTAARGSATSSEAWVAAQAALSGLDAARAPTAAALAELDRLFIGLAETASANAAVGGIEEARAARGEVEALYSAQVARLQALQAALRQP